MMEILIVLGIIIYLLGNLSVNNRLDDIEMELLDIYDAIKGADDGEL